jgi:hypothetical protein
MSTKSPKPFDAYGEAFSALQAVEKDAYTSIDAMAHRMRETVASVIDQIYANKEDREWIACVNDPIGEAYALVVEMLESWVIYQPVINNAARETGKALRDF